MTGRSGRMVLALVLGLLAPAGCMSWQCGMPPMMLPLHPSEANPAGDLSSAQAAQLCLTAGDALEKKGFTAEAIRQYENARQHDPQARTVARRLAVLYDLQGDAARAEAEYQRALQEQSGDAELLNDFGYFHYRHEHLQVAENWLRNAITVNPGCNRAWINLGQVLARQGRVEESYQAFAHVLRPAEAYSNLGVLLAKQGRTNDARGALQQAIALDPALEQPRAFLKALPSSPALLPTDLLPNAPSRSAFAPISKPSPAVRNALPRSPLNVPPPSLMRLPPPPPPSLPPLSALPAANRAAPSDNPVIVHGPIPPVPVASSPMLTVPRPLPSAPPPPPPPPAPRSSVAVDAPIILRTSASFAQTSTTRTAAAADEPLPLPLPPSSIPLRPVPRTPPPQATLTDCQSEQQPESNPQ